MNKERAKIFMMVDRDQLKEIVEQSVRKAISQKANVNQVRGSQLGDFIPQSEAMKILNKKTTWFHLKRKSGELPAIKSANQWWYKKEDLEAFVKNGCVSSI